MLTQAMINNRYICASGNYENSLVLIKYCNASFLNTPCEATKPMVTPLS